MKTALNYLVLLYTCLIVVSCGEQKKIVQKQNQAVLYKPSANIVRPEFSVYHVSDSVSHIYVKINLDDLVFNQANPQNKLIGKVRIFYQVIDITSIPNNTEIEDSTTYFRELVRNSEKQTAVLHLPVRALRGSLYKVKIEVYDLIRELGNQAFVTIDKRNVYSAQNFKIVLLGQNAPAFKPYFSAGDSFRVLTHLPIKHLYIRYMADRSTLPRPPFSSLTEPVFEFNGDSVWKIPYTSHKLMNLPYSGLYFVQSDTMAREGLFLANFGKSFPNVTEAETLVPPLEFLTTTEEFRTVKSKENLKLAVDSFWLSLSKNTEVGRELIRIYYNRMQYANMYFTSYKQGWKTDRGMIYMIFGPPSYIRKTAVSETWEYYVQQSGSNLSINFIKVVSPFTENHYIMQHNEAYTPFWRDAVSEWRSGTAYSLEE